MATHADPPKTPAAKSSAKAVAKDDLQKLPLAEVEKRLSSSPNGLTEAEAKKRLTQYGLNEIAEKKTNALLKFLGYFWGPIPWMIEVAVVLSAVVRHWPDFFIILVLLLANATIGFWEEREADNAIDALKARLAIKARVKRDGKWVTPPAKDLVPGDAIRLRLGDIVPADKAARHPAPAHESADSRSADWDFSGLADVELAGVRLPRLVAPDTAAGADLAVAVLQHFRLAKFGDAAGA